MTQAIPFGPGHYKNLLPVCCSISLLLCYCCCFGWTERPTLTYNKDYLILHRNLSHGGFWDPGFVHNTLNLLQSKQNKQKKNPAPHSGPPLQHLYIHASGTENFSVSHSPPFCPIRATQKMCIAMRHWSNSRLWHTIITGPSWKSSSIRCCCPGSWRSCGYGSTGPVPSYSPAGQR